MKNKINTLTVLVYIVYAVAIYFYLFMEDYKTSSIILMFAVLGINLSYSLFKSHLKMLLMNPEEKQKEMVDMLNSFKPKKTDIPNCKCSNPQWCDTWCISKENYTKASKHGID